MATRPKPVNCHQPLLLVEAIRELKIVSRLCNLNSETVKQTPFRGSAIEAIPEAGIDGDFHKLGDHRFSNRGTDCVIKLIEKLVEIGFNIMRQLDFVWPLAN